MKKRGVGVGCMWYGIGNTGAPNPAGAFLDFLEDGTVLVLTGCADIGQGSSTVLAQIAAEELGVPVEDVLVAAGDTGVSPDAGATSASRQTYISGNAVRLAARQAKQVLLAEAAQMLGVPAEDLKTGEGRIQQKSARKSVSIKEVLASCRARGKLTLGSGWFNPPTTVLDGAGQGVPYATYSFATQVAEVEVDTETGKVRVLRIVAAHDVGRAVNPQAVEGQIEGGCAMGLGYALTEEVQVASGEIKNTNFSAYILPMSLDMPDIYPIIVEESEPTGPFGAKGVGEPALIPTAAAIANAVADALGVRFYELPITLEKVVQAVSGLEK
ncbi:MAG: molybdopterin cofactor-binding domain-containing protein [Bacillota bacterium]